MLLPASFEEFFLWLRPEMAGILASLELEAAP